MTDHTQVDSFDYLAIQLQPAVDIKACGTRFVYRRYTE